MKPLHHCPCCGNPTAAPTPAELAARALPPNSANIVRALTPSFGEFMRTNRLANELWGRMAHGGPENPRQVISQSVRIANAHLASFGLKIEGKRWFGYRLVEA